MRPGPFRTIVWLSAAGGLASVVAVWVDTPRFASSGSGDLAQVLATLMVAATLEAPLLRGLTRVVMATADFALLGVAAFVVMLVVLGVLVATIATAEGRALTTPQGALVMGAVASTLILVMGLILLGGLASLDE